MMRNAEKIAAANAARREAGRQQREVWSHQLRAVVDRGVSVTAAGKELGWGISKTKDIAAEFGIKASPATILDVKRRAAKANIARVNEARKAAAAAPNPYRTTAQQQNISDLKRRMWDTSRGTPLASLPPVTDDEAARLIAEHIAKRGVTVCQPTVTPLIPCNYGQYFR